MLLEIVMGKKTFLGFDFDKVPKMSKEDWVLLILAQHKKEISLHYTALMNEVFFFLKEFAPELEGEFGFRGTGSGPYSKEVAAAVDKLISENMLEIRKYKNTGITFLSPTEKGNERAQSHLKRIPKTEQGRIGFAQFLAQQNRH